LSLRSKPPGIFVSLQFDFAPVARRSARGRPRGDYARLRLLCRFAPNRLGFSFLGYSILHLWHAARRAVGLAAITRDYGNAGDPIRSSPSVAPCFKVFLACFDPRLSVFIRGKFLPFPHHTRLRRSFFTTH